MSKPKDLILPESTLYLFQRLDVVFDYMFSHIKAHFNLVSPDISQGHTDFYEVMAIIYIAVWYAGFSFKILFMENIFSLHYPYLKWNLQEIFFSFSIHFVLHFPYMSRINRHKSDIKSKLRISIGCWFKSFPNEHFVCPSSPLSSIPTTFLFIRIVLP